MASSPDDKLVDVDCYALATWTKDAINRIGGKNKLARALEVATHTILRYERGAANRIQENQIKAIAAFDKKTVQETLNMLAMSEDIGENSKALSNPELTTSIRLLENNVNELTEGFKAFLAEMDAMTGQITYLAEEVRRLKDERRVRGSKEKRIENASGE